MNAENDSPGDERRQSSEDRDNPNRSNKKIKTGTSSSPSEQSTLQENFPSLEDAYRKTGGTTATSPKAPSYSAMVKGEEEQQGYKRFDNPFWDDNMMEADLEEEDENPGEEDPDCPSIKITAEERERIRKPWKDAIIIKVLDKQLGYMYLRRKLQQKWGPKGQFLMADIGNDFYVVKFTNMDDLKFVLSQGPWLIGDNYLTIQRWRPNFIAEEEKLQFIAAWIRIPNLSMEYFDSGVLTMIGKHVGRVLKIDKTTAMGERGRFTRLCVEVDTEKPLLSKFKMIGRIWRIQYEGFKMICFNCGKLGMNRMPVEKVLPMWWKKIR
ncbi:hypothetical protein V2J09_020382 [Rumex salicifolius]